jgi:hypothetical protein
MKFIKTPDDGYVFAKRAQVILSKFRDIVTPVVEGMTIEQVAVGRSIDPNDPCRLFLYHSNAGFEFDTMDPIVRKVRIIPRSAVICLIELQPGEEVVDRETMLPIVDPESEWVSGFTHGSGN